MSLYQVCIQHGYDGPVAKCPDCGEYEPVDLRKEIVKIMSPKPANVVKESDIEDYVMVCPYCGSEVSSNQRGCCGESREHFERAAIVGGELILVSELEFEPETA